MRNVSLFEKAWPHINQYIVPDWRHKDNLKFWVPWGRNINVNKIGIKDPET